MTTKTSVQVQLSGEDGNVYAIIGRVRRALKRAGHEKLAEEYSTACLAAKSYNEVLQITMLYVEVE